MRIAPRFGLVAAALLAAAAPVAAQPWQGPAGFGRGGGELTLFADVGFRGRAVTLVGDAPQLSPIGFNDAASSARAQGGLWELCEHEYFGGRCFAVRGGEPDFVRLGANDAVSSARLVSSQGGRGRRNRDRRDGGGWNDGWGGGRGDEAVLFEHEGFGGRAVAVSPEEPDLRRLGFSDQASSIRLGRGLWEVCEHVGYGGRCERLSGDVGDLRAVGLHDRISSLRRIR